MKSFNRQSLHKIGNSPNPYEQAITIVGKALAPFDEDNLIPCFGFGDGKFNFVLFKFMICTGKYICTYTSSPAN